jgi:hypothetical protein
MAAFNVVYESKHGPTVHSDNPRIDVYKYLSRAVVADGLARGYTLVCNADGSYTATVDGLMPLTFETGN